MKRTIVVLGVSLMVLACRDTATQAPVSDKPPTVEYSQKNGTDADVAKYTNADWLYQNYFGEYGLPAELKQLMLPELQMIANGFALQLGRGENVKESIAQLNQGMQMLHYSGQFGLGLQQMQAEYVNGVYDVQPKPGSEPPQGQVTVAMDDETRASLEEAQRLDAEYAREQEELVKQYGLPYALPERVSKYVIYSPAMKRDGGKGGSRPRGGSGGGSSRSHRIESWDWWEGDILWSNGGSGLTGHMGIVDTTYNDQYNPPRGDWEHNVTSTHQHTPQVIDSNTGPGVAKHPDVNVWASKYSRVEGLSYRYWWRHEGRRNNAVAYANSLIGYPYNWVFWNKEANNSTYCSQLVWQAYKGQFVDLDRDGGLIVWPEDIRSHPDILRFAASSI